MNNKKISYMNNKKISYMNNKKISYMNNKKIKTTKIIKKIFIDKVMNV